MCYVYVYMPTQDQCMHYILQTHTNKKRIIFSKLSYCLHTTPHFTLPKSESLRKGCVEATAPPAKPTALSEAPDSHVLCHRPNLSPAITDWTRGRRLTQSTSAGQWLLRWPSTKTCQLGTNWSLLSHHKEVMPWHNKEPGLWLHQSSEPWGKKINQNTEAAT